MENGDQLAEINKNWISTDKFLNLAQTMLGVSTADWISTDKFLNNRSNAKILTAYGYWISTDKFLNLKVLDFLERNGSIEYQLISF